MESLFYRIEKLKTERDISEKKLHDINSEMDNLYNEIKELVEENEHGNSKKNNIEKKNEYRKVSKTFLNNYTECRTCKENDKYMGDINYFSDNIMTIITIIHIFFILLIQDYQ